MQFRTKNDLEAILGEEESRTLEFKSSIPLSHDSNKVRKFVADTIVKAATSFLNSDGGILIIGIEEDKNEKGVCLSPGIPRTVIKREQLQNMIIGMIQPSVGDLLSVRAIRVDDNDEEHRFAFCVDVRAGNTAYQSADKLYYSRREGQSIAMDDKDIRLRMLAGDKPRVEISLQHDQLFRPGEAFWPGIVWKLTIKNIGLKTINRALVRYALTSDGLSEDGAKIAAFEKAEYFTNFGRVSSDETGLMPADSWSRNAFKFDSRWLDNCSAEPSVKVDIGVLIDDGLPAIMNFDVMAAIRPLIESGWPDTHS
jgi:Putative DNA-binding domain